MCNFQKINQISKKILIKDSSAEFKEGLNRIRTLLNIPTKPDDTTAVLQAVSKLICEKLNPNAIKSATQPSSTNDQVRFFYFVLNDF